MWLTIIAVVTIVVVATLVAAATRPDSFTVRRGAEVRAAPAAIYPLLADFREWPRWSPWEKLDPAMKRTLSGAPSGAGAVYAWEGSRKVGAGRMEILEVAPPLKVVIQLDFIKPFEGHNVTEFAVVPKGDASDVEWTMRGPATFIMKVMGLFTDFDKMIGRDFERGLANLKAVAEKT